MEPVRDDAMREAIDYLRIGGTDPRARVHAATVVAMRVELQSLRHRVQIAEEAMIAAANRLDAGSGEPHEFSPGELPYECAVCGRHTGARVHSEARDEAIAGAHAYHYGAAYLYPDCPLCNPREGGER